MAQAIPHLPSKCKVLSSNSNTTIHTHIQQILATLLIIILLFHRVLKQDFWLHLFILETELDRKVMDHLPWQLKG
jgi:hypothetical protein